MRFRERTNYLVQRLIIAGFSLAAGILALATGCDPRMTSALKRLEEGETRPVAKKEAALPPHQDGQLRIATFNLGVFGVEKVRHGSTLNLLADILRQFDVVAVQEIRSVDQSVLTTLVDRINALALPNGTTVAYDFVVGPRLGRTNSKEQYAFVFNTSRVAIDPSNVYTLVDGQDLLHREPFVARFIARTTDHAAPFSFTLVNMHTDPDEARKEVDLLVDVLDVVRNDGSREDDVILLGDFNLAPEHFGRLAQSPYVKWVVQGVPTNMRQNKTYDNILFSQNATVEYRSGGVFDVRQIYNLSEKQALEISDHLPVWADFQMRENTPVGPLVQNGIYSSVR